MHGQFRGIISIRKSETVAVYSQLVRYGFNTLLYFLERPSFGFVCENCVCHAMSTDGEPTAMEAAGFVPGHRSDVVILVNGFELISLAVTLQALSQNFDGKSFERLQPEFKRAKSESSHQLLSSIKPEHFS